MSWGESVFYWERLKQDKKRASSLFTVQRIIFGVVSTAGNVRVLSVLSLS